MIKSSKIICLIGPTAAGKTELSLYLAEHFPIDIVSVDSAMVYRTMDIGTAKPSLEQRSKVDHHLIDLCDPIEVYSAAKFVTDALKAIKAIQKRGKIPMLVGGTMLYFKALQQGLSPLPAANQAIRNDLSAKAAREGWAKMHQWLAKVDPQSAKRILPTDPQRLQRALEVWQITGQPLSALWDLPKQRQPLNYLNIAVSLSDRSQLHQRIERRFKDMLAQGFIEEVEQLYRRGDLTSELPSIRSVGYRQIWQYLDGQLSYHDMTEKGVAATRQLAKRQLTWLRAWPAITWFDSDDSRLAIKVLQHIKNMNTKE